MNESDIAAEEPEAGLELSAQDKKRRRRRSLAIALGLIFLVALFYLMTIYKFGPELMNRTL